MDATGIVVLHSAGLPVGLTEAQYMDICYAMIRACNEIVKLPGWRRSAGATAEYYYAKKIGLKIVFVPTGIDIERGMSLVS
ncbi:DUF4406 domain-containing protein [Shewanella xiamenensis]|uniref:DUF4406 domain-containing protein n=1 Tax=Shewanella xiamenensis TaxID=332186 RepID=UPI00217E1D94|nr:DUF4406 domain-containing protein [Shewanella xiamenensis]